MTTPTERLMSGPEANVDFDLISQFVERPAKLT